MPVIGAVVTEPYRAWRLEWVESIADCRLGGRLVHEPMAALLGRLAGCSELAVDDPRLPDCLVIYDKAGYAIPARRPGADCAVILNTAAPLRPCRNYTYWGPTEPTWVISGSPAIVTDVFIASNGRLVACRPRLGCTTLDTSVDDSVDEVDTRIYRPSIIFPTVLSHVRYRVRDQVVLDVPWLCVKGPLGATILVCRKGLCRFTVDAAGRVMAENEALLIKQRQCNTLFVERLRYGITVASIGLASAARNVPLFVEGSLLPLRLMVEGDKEAIVDAILWNPSPTPGSATIRMHKYKPITGRIEYVDGRIEAVDAGHYWITISIGGYDLARLVLKIRKILF